MFDFLDPGEINAVIVGQSPYPDPKDACGIPFLSKTGRRTRSLMALMREAGAERGADPNGAVAKWIGNGVFLFNASMTMGIGGEAEYLFDHSVMWKEFTSSLLEYITTVRKGVPVVLMGKDAWGLEDFAKTRRVIKVPHPVARNDGFKGCRVFNKLDGALREFLDSDEKIEWV